jgi:hypothetical protein
MCAYSVTHMGIISIILDGAHSKKPQNMNKRTKIKRKEWNKQCSMMTPERSGRGDKKN